jgi:hypothetical protein
MMDERTLNYFEKVAEQNEFFMAYSGDVKQLVATVRAQAERIKALEAENIKLHLDIEKIWAAITAAIVGAKPEHIGFVDSGAV